jgi:hypothetical protein
MSVNHRTTNLSIWIFKIVTGVYAKALGIIPIGRHEAGWSEDPLVKTWLTTSNPYLKDCHPPVEGTDQKRSTLGQEDCIGIYMLLTFYCSLRLLDKPHFLFDDFHFSIMTMLDCSR